MFFLNKNRQSKSEQKEEKPKVEITKDNICEVLPKELIEEAIGRKIVKVEKSLSSSCAYYLDYKEDFFGPGQAGGPHILIGLNDENYEQIKQQLSRPGIDNEFVKDNRISVNHYLIKSRVGKIWEVDLFLNDREYLGIKSNYEAATGEELIKIAVNIVNQKSEFFSSQESQNQNNIPLPQEEDIIRNFTSLIENGKPDEAAKMMKTNNDSELQAWAVQFSNITSFKLLKIEKFNENEWTDNKHIYKVIFDIWMDPRSADAPISYYGWQNGQNTRWLTLEKVGNIWKIAEITSGP